MARRQTLVQLSDDLIASVDEHAGRVGASRSEIIRRALRQYLDGTDAGAIDRAITEGYTRIPPDEQDPWADAAARRSIRDEPW